MAVDAVMEGWARAAFRRCTAAGGTTQSANRPMGFCLFNKRCRGGRMHARARWGVCSGSRVVDFDVHSRQRYPGRCSPPIRTCSMRLRIKARVTQGRAEPWEKGCVRTTSLMRRLLTRVTVGWRFARPGPNIILPALDAFRTGTGDRLGRVRRPCRPIPASAVAAGDHRTYGWITDQLILIAEKHCGGRLVSVDGGGLRPERFVRLCCVACSAVDAGR